MTPTFSTRDKAILIGLYLSRFDKMATLELGFVTTSEAFNTLGYSIGVKPNSIKNYRDEFDPYFPNDRKGWKNREIREYCKTILVEFSSLDFNNFTDLIKSFVLSNYDVEKIVDSVTKQDRSESVAKRLITGKAAEEYFKLNFQSVVDFNQHVLTDTTNLACGFDFKLSFDLNFYCVEVKGLNNSFGSISMTEKEFSMANHFKDKYCLFVVTNFVDKPNHQCFFDPLNSRLSFKKVERQVLQINYNSAI